ncbi:MAG: CHAD domain-containing protein, partial [Bacteroidales bacterium]|nr:CHAD domain-containing protein [Bacteroidales bacterium]
MKQDLARFHDSSQAQLIEGLRRYIEFQEPEDLHNLRLSIKKLRVFYGFLSPLNDKLLPAAIEFLEVSDIVFRYGGRRRDVYIQQQHLGRLELSLGKPFPEYHDFLGDTAHRREVKLQEILKSQPLLNVLPHGKLISNTLGSMSERALERHFRREAGQLYEAFRFRCQEWASDGDPEHLHKARRELKALMYLLN